MSLPSEVDQRQPALPNPFVMLGRALVLRCPRCGGGRLFVSWFTLEKRCPTCELPLQRGEAHDYWIGGMMFNIVLSELLAVLTVSIVLLSTWPQVPWNTVWFGAIALMLAAPFLLYPVSRIVWLAFDLIFRPHHESHYR